jgi:hypothetical protein
MRGMLPFLFRWIAPHLYVVRRCPGCLRADVRVRWPERFDGCPHCGAFVSAQPPARPSDGGAEGGDEP